MEKRKRWQFILIVVAIALTIYNILPTVFYYTKPLKSHVDASRAKGISLSIMNRVNDLEKESVDWLHSYCKLLNINPSSVEIDQENPERIRVRFSKQKEAEKLSTHLPRAGALIPFVPSQLALNRSSDEDLTKDVWIQRKIPVHFDKANPDLYFTFSTKKEADEQTSPLYQDIISDRAAQLGVEIAGTSEPALMVETILKGPTPAASQDLVYAFSNHVLGFVRVFGEDSPISARFFSNLFQGNFSNPKETQKQLTQVLSQTRDQLKLERIQLLKKEEELKKNKGFLHGEDKQQIRLLERKEKNLAQTESLLKNHTSQLLAAKSPWTYNSVFEDLKSHAKSDYQTLSVASQSPFIDSLQIDWNNDEILLTLHSDLFQFKKSIEDDTHLLDSYEQLMINEIARLSRQTGEQFNLHPENLSIALNTLTGSQSVLVMKLNEIAKQQAAQIQKVVSENWEPTHPELKNDAFPVYDFQTYQQLPPEQKGLCLVVYAPANDHSTPAGMRSDSIYVIAKGLNRILQKYQINPAGNESAQDFFKDFQDLQTLLTQNGFIGYYGYTLPYVTEFSQDFVFEKSDAFHNIIAATREQFHIQGTKKYAVLEFTDVEQRILALNKIETQMQEDLLKARDDYNSAQVSMNDQIKWDVPKPSQNVFTSNLALSLKKYFRGDDRKVLHWGLDLSGGKTVQIELRDQHNHKVTEEADLKQGVNELFGRVNKMGVSEVSIRTEGSNIVLDFPGSQGLSASELIKASSMFFHVVNEKFTPTNSDLSDSVTQFLQEVWNEAVVTNRKDAASVNSIAWKHLYGDSLDPDVIRPRSEAAKTLYENGLRLSSPFDTDISSNFNDSISKIAVIRGDDFTEWQNQSHPLMVVFRNYTLEGSDLENINASYDASKGNFLSFEVKGTHSKEGAKISPRDDLFSWTSQFSKEKIAGTPLESYTHGKGWRMAVILNDTIISSPTLDSALRDRAMISGNFSQREVNQLSADLKAGSLTYTPHILSEKNVSPELGKQDRMKGVVAMTVALLLVIGTMIAYYRFAGIIASIAVLFNLFIMWATLQNLGVTLSLAGIAGIILTVGMAVDANVLVFERIKEEFATTKRLASAVQAGYRKAFSAIIDSNVTTIIAALILLNFDSGPIKGFAVTLIIGIASSMFTALFMTRFFFAGWVQNPKNKTLKMANFIRSTKFNFLKWGKQAFIVSGLIIILGSFALSQKKNTMFGMDFTGGFGLNLELVADKGTDYRKATEDALINAGLDTHEFQIRELNPSNNLRILLSTTLDEEGRPFEGMPLIEDKSDVTYSYESNPRILWVVNALEEAGLKINERELANLDSNWTAMSGQMSESMRNNAVMGLALALIAIMIYLTFRFEFKFSISAMLCILHDVLISIGAIALLNYLGVPVQIDLHTVAALMTIIGYSLNDTIIVFDRIREDIRIMRKSSMKEIVNHSLNITLSRTTITSATTFFALIALVALGGSSIFSFALVMAIGVVFGTLSSLFIASPLMLLFHRREETDEKNRAYTRQASDQSFN